MAEAALETRSLSKDFGGLHAVRAVSLALAKGSLHALIGPNGAGKTTLINLLSGTLPPSSGSVWLDGRDITGLAPHRIARLGLGRCHQRTSVFPEATCLENCWLGARTRGGSGYRFWRPAVGDSTTREWAEQALEICGLQRQRDRKAGTLSHGEQKQLEIALTLAAAPQVLLLDEPLAGMGPEEADGMTALIRNLAGDHTVLLVEHDMDAVFQLAAQITVMVDGRVLATGTPEAIKADPQVQDAYLGHPEEAS